MANVKIHVWHNAVGEIVAVGRPLDDQCLPLGAPDQPVIETEIEEEHVERLHQTHVVDIHRRAMLRRSDLRLKGRSGADASLR